WGGDASGTTNPLTVTMTGPKSIVGRFTYALVVDTVGRGTVAKSPNQPGYPPEATVQLTATPATGYHFTGWSGDTTSASNPITLTMSSDKHVTANFVINTYPLNVTIVGSGTVAKSPDQP